MMDTDACYPMTPWLALHFTSLQFVLTDYGGLQVDKDRTRHMLSGTSLAEERVERVVASSNGLVAGHLAVGLDAVLQTVQLPAGVAHLHSGLADMDADAFTLQRSQTLFCNQIYEMRHHFVTILL